MKSLSSFNSKLVMPCRKFFTKLLCFPITRRKKTLSFKFLFKRRRTMMRRASFLSLRAMLGLRRVTQDIEALDEIKSSRESCVAPFPSPLTPSYVKLAAARGSREEEVEEACRSFVNYLVDMIVEEGKVEDLKAVEELLLCWDSLKSPVFIELVGSFYGEICRDLISARKGNNKVDDD